jgi:hypothetical protein
VEKMVMACRERGLEESQDLQQQLSLLKKDGHHGQKEALLRFLHVSWKDGLLVDVAFASQGEHSANGWTSLRVNAQTSGVFFERLVSLFGLQPQQAAEGSTSWRTVNNSLERFGLRPHAARGARSIWAKAYAGTIPFIAIRDDSG